MSIAQRFGPVLPALGAGLGTALPVAGLDVVVTGFLLPLPLSPIEWTP